MEKTNELPDRIYIPKGGENYWGAPTYHTEEADGYVEYIRADLVAKMIDSLIAEMEKLKEVLKQNE